MDNKERLRKINEYNNKNESINDTLKDDLDFSDDSELYKFVYENEFVLLNDPVDYDTFFILKLKEYFILKHLSENLNRPLGVLETSKDLGLKIDEGKNLFKSLEEKKLIKEVHKELYMRETYTSLTTFGYFGYRYIEDKYYITISNIKNNMKKFEEDKYERLDDLRKKKKNIEIFTNVLNIISIILSIIALLLFLFLKFKYGIFFFAASFVIFNVRFLDEIKYSDSKINEIENEIELSDINASSIEKRAERLFRSHHIELGQYYNEILKQSKTIFKWGIVCIVLGMTLIVLSVLIVGFSSKINLEIKQSQIIAIISGIGGLFSNIVAGFYMNMYNKTMKSLDSFHNRFVGTHHLHFGNLLLSKIEDKETREKAYASIFKDMVISMDKTNDFTK